MPDANFIAIGHITQDLLPGGDYAPGGTVSFSAIAARNFGQSAGIVTVCPDFLRHFPVYANIKIAGPYSPNATIFENIYKPEGREQFVRSVAPAIRPNDVPPEWVGPNKNVQIVHIGPVAQECLPELLDLFPDALIGITPQGFMRDWNNPTGRVNPVLWEGERAQAMLRRAGALVLSEEDLPRGAENRRLLAEYIAACPIVAYTQGAQGCTLFYDGKRVQVPAFPAKEIDPTGAGDVFAAAFFIRLRATNDPIAAARFANAAAACNIEGLGLSGIPTLAQVEARLESKSEV